MTDPTLAFDTTKCGLPVIPQIPEVSLQNCIVPTPALPPRNTGGVLITPAIPALPPINTLSSDFLQLGIAQQDIPAGGSGTVIQYSCDTATTTSKTVYARINPIKQGDWVYWVVFPNNNDAVSSACDFTPRVCTLDSALDPATNITTPTIATGTGYTYQGGTLVSMGAVTILNYESSLTGAIGDTILALPLSCAGLSCLVAIAADKIAPQSQWGVTNVQGGTGQSFGACAPCVSRDLLVLYGNTMPDMFIISGVPQILGGDANGYVRVYAGNSYAWTSDSFHIACGSGADRFYWLLGLSNNACNGAAIISLIHQTGTNCSGSFPNQTTPLYYNLEEFQVRCGSYMYLTEDVCLPDIIRANLPCRVCVSASSGLQQTTTTITIDGGGGGGGGGGGTGPTTNPAYPCGFNSGTGNFSLDCIASKLYPYGGRTSNTLPNYLTLEFTGFNASTGGYSQISPALLTTITNNIVNTQFQLRLTHNANNTYTWNSIGATDFFTMSGVTYSIIAGVSCIYDIASHNCRFSAGFVSRPSGAQYTVSDGFYANGTPAVVVISMNVTDPNNWTGTANTYLIKLGSVAGGERAGAQFILYE